MFGCKERSKLADNLDRDIIKFLSSTLLNLITTKTGASPRTGFILTVDVYWTLVSLLEFKFKNIKFLLLDC